LAGTTDDTLYKGYERNAAKLYASTPGARPIHRRGAPVEVWVVPTDVELEIAERTLRCIQRGPRAQ
jgi:acetate kinase